MAHNPALGLSSAQLVALLAAAGGVAPVGNAPAGQPVQGAAPEQANLLAQLMQALQNQQAVAQPAPWAGLAQLFQAQPAPQPAPHQQPAKDVHEEAELEYRNARSDQLDKTLVLFLRAAQSSNMTRFAILLNMDGRHGHSAEWWKNYYLIFADDIDRLVNADVGRTDVEVEGGGTSTSHRKSYSGNSLRPVVFPSASQSPLSSRKRKAPQDPLSSDSDTAAVITGSRARTSHVSSVRPSSKTARHAQKRDDPDSDSDEPGVEKAKRWKEPAYKLSIPDKLPKRAPSAPTKIVSNARGHHKFTDEDQAYFVDLILWQAKTVRDASKRTIHAALSAEATHHSSGSWDSFWTRAKGEEVLREGLRMAAAANATSAGIGKREMHE